MVRGRIKRTPESNTPSSPFLSRVHQGSSACQNRSGHNAKRIASSHRSDPYDIEYNPAGSSPLRPFCERDQLLNAVLAVFLEFVRGLDLITRYEKV